MGGRCHSSAFLESVAAPQRFAPRLKRAMVATTTAAREAGG
jgi:hypothetical protein